MVTATYPPRLFDAGGDLSKTWYIDYRIWDTDKGAVVRKRYEGMNKHRTLAARRRAAKVALAEIVALLAQGFTTGEAPTVDIGLDAQRATLLEAVQFVGAQKKRAAGRSGEDYSRLACRVKEYPAFANLPLALARPAHVLAFMTWLSKRPKFGPKSYNSYRDTLSSVFNYLVKLEVLERNPVRGVERHKVPDSDKHQPYTEAQRRKVVDELAARGNTQLLLFISFIYYCFIRSGGELRLLRVRDILDTTVRVPGGTAKNSKAEHVTIPKKLKLLIEQHELKNYPADYYIFTRREHPGPVPVGKNFFARQHRDVLNAVGIPADYTVYGYKHTGAVNLYLATKDIELVRQHCRHAHAGMTATYLRGLGAIDNAAALDQMPDF